MGGEHMSDRERRIAENLVEAVTRLPDSKREFLLGYAEGVAAMADKTKAEEAETSRKEEPA